MRMKERRTVNKYYKKYGNVSNAYYQPFNTVIFSGDNRLDY